MRKGFTLVEVLIVIGLFGFLMVVATDFLIQVMLNSRRSSIDYELRQDGSKVLQEISASIRTANCVSWDYDSANRQKDVNLTTYVDACNGTVLDNFKFMYVSYMAATDANRVTNSGRVYKKVGANWQQISANSAVISCPGSGSNECVPDWTTCQNGVVVSGTSGSDRAVTLSLSIQSTTSATRPDYCIKRTVSDTITPRGGQR